MRFRLLGVTMLAAARMFTRNSGGLGVNVVPLVRFAVARGSVLMTRTLVRRSRLVVARMRFAAAVARAAMFTSVLMTRAAIVAVAVAARLTVASRRTLFHHI